MSALAQARWFGGKGRGIDRIEPVEGFDLGGGHGLAVAEIRAGGSTDRYLFAVIRDGGTVRAAEPGEGAYRALAAAMAEGRTIAAVPHETTDVPAPGPVRAALVCRPAGALRRLVDGGPSAVGGLDERPLGADQSNTSVVLGERLLLKAYRRLEDGLNPELELNAFLTEEVGFAAVPALAGYAELVTPSGAATLAILQEFVAGGADAYETIAEQLAAWILAPGEVTVEFATEVAAELGALTAELHGALSTSRVPGFEPREATRDELRRWREEAHRQLDRALEVVDGEAAEELRRMAPTIAEQLDVLEAVATVPIVTRVHADLHLGQILLTPDGARIVDFEGEPTRAIEDRRRPTSPLRDAASMLRSLDHVGRSARRRAERRRGRLLERVGLDVEAWIGRARERFLDGYRRGLREAGAPIEVDEDLLLAFEFEKESYEFVYAATWLPDWMWAPLGGMRALVAEARRR